MPLPSFPEKLHVGASVQVQTVGGQTITGIILGYSKSTVSIQSAASATSVKVNLHVLTPAGVDQFDIVPSTTASIPTFTPIDTQKLAAREAHMTALAAARASQQKAGVAAIAQTLFDALAKTYDCVWRDQDIIVEKHAIIRAPYTAEAVFPSSPGVDTRLIARVQSVVSRILQRQGE